MEEADAIEMSKFSSLEHLQHMTEFIKNAYKQELSNKMTDFKIFYK